MKKILIIEDEPDAAETMKMLLERAGYSVDYVLDPRKGLKMLGDYDLLILDIIMPVMSGREVLAEIKRKKIKIPIIVVSAVGLPGEVERELALKYPGVGFVPKLSISELPGEVKKKLAKQVGE